ncbi:MAG: hypothetical protein PHV32_07485 [Eubacteriales bacterium]|nr:hypothetical protein [Eubacteriales bacterium]
MEEGLKNQYRDKEEEASAGSTENVRHEGTTNFPCPGCGAIMTFKPDTQQLYCGYCSRSIDISKEGSIREYDFFTAGETNEGNWGSEKRVMKCENCGAQTVLDIYIHAQKCAFCGSSHIVINNESAGIAPESLIPFQISEEQAKANFKKWIKKKFFVPGKAKKEYVMNKLNGVYVPFWTYDTDTFSSYMGEAGEYYYVTRHDWATVNGKRQMVTRRERKIRWYPTSGVYTSYFDDVIVNASRNMDEKALSDIYPFQLDRLVPYKPEYLSGFLAERYGIGLTEGWQKGRETVKNGIYKGIVRQIHADEVRNLQVNTQYRSITYKHILLPLWLSAFTYKEKLYRYMVNGQTGVVQGKAPVSGWKVAGLILSLLAAAAIVLSLLAGR